MKRIILKVLIMLVLISIISNIYLFLENKVMALSDPTEVPPEFWISGNKDIGEDELIRKGAPVLGLIRIFGMIASIITLAIIGIRIMYAGVEEKAAYKQTLIPWAVGAVMLFAMTTIPSLVFNIIGEENMEKDLVSSGDVTVRVMYCINGNKMKYDPHGNVFCPVVSTCGCGNKISNDSDYKYHCAKCDSRLTEISNYYWCYNCQKRYDKD